MHIGHEAVGEAAQEFLHQGKGKLSDAGYLGGRTIIQEGASAEINDHAGQGFIHGEKKGAVTHDPDFVTQSLLDGLSEHDASVFHGVVIVHVEVAFDLNLQIHQAVFGKQREHVIKETNAGIDLGFTRAIDGEAELDVGFGGGAGNARAAGDVGHKLEMSCKIKFSQEEGKCDDSESLFRRCRRLGGITVALRWQP